MKYNVKAGLARAGVAIVVGGLCHYLLGYDFFQAAYGALIYSSFVPDERAENLFNWK